VPFRAARRESGYARLKDHCERDGCQDRVRVGRGEELEFPLLAQRALKKWGTPEARARRPRDSRRDAGVTALRTGSAALLCRSYRVTELNGG